VSRRRCQSRQRLSVLFPLIFGPAARTRSSALSPSSPEAALTGAAGHSTAAVFYDGGVQIDWRVATPVFLAEQYSGEIAEQSSLIDRALEDRTQQQLWCRPTMPHTRYYDRPPPPPPSVRTAGRTWWGCGRRTCAWRRRCRRSPTASSTPACKAFSWFSSV